MFCFIIPIFICFFQDCFPFVSRRIRLFLFGCLVLQRFNSLSRKRKNIFFLVWVFGRWIRKPALGDMPVHVATGVARPQASESTFPHHVVSDCVSFATTFFKKAVFHARRVRIRYQIIFFIENGVYLCYYFNIK